MEQPAAALEGRREELLEAAMTAILARVPGYRAAVTTIGGQVQQPHSMTRGRARRTLRP